MPGQGFAHVCAGSGTYLAAEGHEAGQVEEPSVDWPRFDVHITFQIRALDKPMVRDKLIPLVTELLKDNAVEHSNFSIVLAEQESVA